MLCCFSGHVCAQLMCLQSALVAGPSSGRVFIAYSQWLFHSLIPSVQRSAASSAQDNAAPSGNHLGDRSAQLPTPALPLAQDAIR